MADSDSGTLSSQTTPEQPFQPAPETRETLERYKKPELRKRCHELGLSSVWVRKDQLINMILQHSQRHPASCTNDTVPVSHTAPQTEAAQSPRHEAAHSLIYEDQQSNQPAANPPPRAAAPPLQDSPTNPLPDEANQSLQSTHPDSHPTYTGPSLPIDIQKISIDIDNIKAQLHTKDLEIELLNEEVRTAYETIKSLQIRVTNLEQEHRSPPNMEQPETSSSISPRKHTLLLGDENLRRVHRNDMANHCSIKTLHGASVDFLRSWVTGKMNQAPTTCVIYCGVNDIINETPSDKILDDLGSLISDLKEKYEAMNLYICQVVPHVSLDQHSVQITAYNEHLLNWGESNGVKIIKTPPYFTLSTGDLDDLCFESDDNNATLSRPGAVRLLDSINAQCPDFNLCHNWNNVKKTPISVNNVNKVTQTLPPPLSPLHSRSAPRPPSHGPAPLAVPPPPPVLSGRGPAAHRLSAAPGRGTDSSPTFNSRWSSHVQGRAAVSHNTPPRSPDDRLSQPVWNSTRPYTAPISFIPAARWAHHVQGRDTAGPPTPAWRLDDEQPYPGPGYEPHHAAPASRWADHVQGRDMAGYSTPAWRRYDEQPRPAPGSELHYGAPATRWGQAHGRDTARRNTTRWRHHDEQSQPVSSYARPHADPRHGCYNCGEHNHRQATCRFDHRLRCGNCRRLGHKEKLCPLPLA